MPKFINTDRIAMPERVIENQILVWLHYKKVFVWKNPSSGYFDAKRGRFRKHRSPFAINGVSDIIALHKGRAIFIEVKTPKGRVSPEQKAFIEKAKESGAIAFVARSLTDVERELEGAL
jgi:hypothetical protein